MARKTRSDKGVFILDARKVALMQFIIEQDVVSPRQLRYLIAKHGDDPHKPTVTPGRASHFITAFKQQGWLETSKYQDKEGRLLNWMYATRKAIQLFDYSYAYRVRNPDGIAHDLTVNFVRLWLEEQGVFENFRWRSERDIRNAGEASTYPDAEIYFTSQGIERKVAIQVELSNKGSVGYEKLRTTYRGLDYDRVFYFPSPKMEAVIAREFTDPLYYVIPLGDKMLVDGSTWDSY